MGGTRVIPTEVGGANVYALADQRRQIAEDRCGRLVDGAYRWLDGRPGLADLMADPAFELFAAQAITFRRVPADVVAAGGGAIEAWLLESWAARSSVGERAA